MLKKRFDITDKDGVVSERWSYIDDVKRLTNTHPINNKNNGDYPYEKHMIGYVTGDVQGEFNFYDYDKIFLMNDSGKTIETLRFIERKEPK